MFECKIPGWGQVLGLAAKMRVEVQYLPWTPLPINTNPGKLWWQLKESGSFPTHMGGVDGVPRSQPWLWPSSCHHGHLWHHGEELMDGWSLSLSCCLCVCVCMGYTYIYIYIYKRFWTADVSENGTDSAGRQDCPENKRTRCKDQQGLCCSSRIGPSPAECCLANLYL